MRRTSIEAKRHKAGWTRLSAGGRKRRAKALGGRAWDRVPGASSGVASDGDGQDRMTALQIPSIVFRREGSLLPPPVDRCIPMDGDGSNGGD
jgi:hypothetical protein